MTSLKVVLLTDLIAVNLKTMLAVLFFFFFNYSTESLTRCFCELWSYFVYYNLKVTKYREADTVEWE